MKKTENISLGGYPFRIEEDAYQQLQAYLQKIRQSHYSDFDTDEILAGIEERIAEIFIERAGKDGIINIGIMTDAMNRIGNPEGTARNDMAPVKRIYRNIDQKLLGGVCSGISAYLNIDVVFVRLAFVLLFLVCTPFRGFPYPFFAVIFYIVLWIIIPPAKTVEQKCQMTGKPLALDDFKEMLGKSPKAAEEKIKNFGNEIRTAPAVHWTGKFFSSIFGIIFILFGISGLLCCSLYDIIPEAIMNSSGYAPLYDGQDMVEHMLQHPLFLLNPPIWWMILGSAGLLSLWCLYNGVILTFHIKPPKFKPGLVLFILWLVSIIAIIIFIIRKLLIITTMI